MKDSLRFVPGEKRFQLNVQRWFDSSVGEQIKQRTTSLSNQRTSASGVHQGHPLLERLVALPGRISNKVNK